MDASVTNLYKEILKIQSVGDWKYTDSFGGQQFRQFQQFASGKNKDKNFNYILCRMTNNKGAWCAAN